jgi:hypothetical protein
LYRVGVASAPLNDTFDPPSASAATSTMFGVTVAIAAGGAAWWSESLITGIGGGSVSGIVRLAVNGAPAAEVPVTATANDIVPLPVPVYVPAGATVTVSRNTGTSTVQLHYVRLAEAVLCGP